MSLQHFIDTQDFTKEQLLEVIDLSLLIKEAAKQRATPKLLQDASLGMIFEYASTRTRVSFEVAMTQLGGHALYLKPGEIHLGHLEDIGDTANVLSRMVDAIMARVANHETIVDLAKAASVPVINGLTGGCHPTQVVCDIMTILEHMPEGKRLEDLHLVFMGESGPMSKSVMLICTQMGMRFTHVAPEGYLPPSEWKAEAEKNCETSGGSLAVTDEPKDAVKDADFIYADILWWYDDEDIIEERKKIFLPKYQVNMDLLQTAPSHCKFMHCLPAVRNMEATDEVMDSPQSIIFDQAENRLHTEKGILTWLVYPRLAPPEPDLRSKYAEEVSAFLERILD